MNSLPLKHCFKCDKDLPLSLFSKNPDGISYKGQCKSCRNEHEKHRQVKQKALEKGLPPPPPLPKGNISNRGSGINDTQCPKCAVPLLFQHLPMHYEYVCHDSDPKKKCMDCDYETDCYGDLLHHSEHEHAKQLDKPHRTKRVFTCQFHCADHLRKYNSRYYKTPDQLEKTRKRKAKMEVAGKVVQRKQNNLETTKKRKQEYYEANPWVKTSNADYEQDPLRKMQKSYQENTIATANQRKEYKFSNYDMVCNIWRNYHINHRETRNHESAQYALQNTHLKLQKMQHGAKYRGLDFNIGEDDAQKMFLQPCFYCNVEAYNASKSQLCGIDRLYNDEGYEENNCVPCCATCNVMKNSLSVDMYISKLTDIYKFLSMSEISNVPAVEECKKEIVYNVSLMKHVVNTAIPTSVLANSRSRSEMKKALDTLTEDDINEILPEDFDSQSELGLIYDAHKLDYIRELLKGDIYAHLDECAKIQASVEYIGKHEWRLSDVEGLGLMYKTKCAYCGFPGNMGIDRLDSSGAYEIGNVVPACRMCNIIKNCFPLTTFMRVVHDTVKTMGSDKTKNVVDMVLKRAQDLGLNNVTCKRQSNGNVRHFGIDPECSQSTTTRKCRVTDTAAVYQFSDKRNKITYHSRYCGRSQKSKCRLVTMDQLMQLAPTIIPCEKCVTQHAPAEDCKEDLLASGIPWMENGERISLGRFAANDALRVDKWVITDIISNYYHTCIHTSHKFYCAMMPLEVALSLNAKLKPCSKCVSCDEDNPTFDGEVTGYMKLLTLQECTEFLSTVQRQKKDYNAEQQRKGREKSKIPKAVPGDTVFLFKSRSAKTYHTVIHPISNRVDELEESNWLTVKLVECVKAKPCKVCCI